MKFCAILGVLMWKHLIVRKRAFINTAFELVSTFLFIILMLPIRDVDLNKHRYDQEMSSMNIKSPDRIYYTPNNTIYNVLMTKVGTKFDLERVRKMPCLIDEKGIYGFHPDDPEMVAREEKMPLGDVVVKFSLWKTISNESVRDDFPTILVYTVRNANFSQKIRAIGLNDKAILPQLTEEVMFKTDLVQWAIDSAFLEHHEEHKTNSTVRTLKLHIPTSKQPNYSSMVNAGATIFVIIFSVIQPFVGTVTRIIDDSGLQALISISGVSPNIIQLSHVLNSMIVGVFYASLATYLFRSQSEAGNVLIRANTLQLWIYLMLHFLSIVVVAMALSYLLTSSNHVTIISLMIYIVFSAIAIILPFQIKGNWKILFGLLPHVSLFWFFFNSAMQFTFTGKEEIDWSQEYPNVPSMITIWIQILVQIGLWVILAWYLHKVKPGQYGVAYPWNFCCTKMFWSPEAPVVPAELESNREEKMKNIKYFEPKGAIDKLVGIKILGVTKIFYNNGIAFKALDDVSVDIYNGEITMLLGHNGAGKTTLISIITGMYSPTEGQIIIDGQDALAIRSSGQSKIGYCPQHNMFISKLNVLEHVMFFSMIKGVPCKVVKAKSMEILKEVGIADKWNKLPGALSGGMARRLQLTTAMAGDSNVLILDEPTSGLDVETRRSLWDTFLALREGRTLILSTHFPEEADALGDRTIALKHGVIQCSATNMFLKKAIGGGGYQVRVGTENREKIFEMIKSYCPNSTCIHKTDGILVNVPPDQIPHLPKLFEHMESNQASLGYTRIGVGATTLEDVFMKMCSDFDVEELETEVDTAMSHELENRVTGFTLFKRHLKTRIMRDRMLRNIKVNPILNRMCV